MDFPLSLLESLQMTMFTAGFIAGLVSMIRWNFGLVPRWEISTLALLISIATGLL